MKFYQNINWCISGHVVLYKRPEGQEIKEETENENENCVVMIIKRLTSLPRIYGVTVIGF
jgi:hypothetical protein